MTHNHTQPRRKRFLYPRNSSQGFSLLELVTVLAVALIMAAMALPVIQSSLRNFRLRAAVSSVTGAIQSTRYQAIFDGCPYAVSFNKANNTYQVSSAVTGGACAVTLTNVGGAIPFGNPAEVALSQDLTLQFSPGGSVQVIAGASTFNLSYLGTPNQKTIKVTKYGSVTVQ